MLSRDTQPLPAGVHRRAHRAAALPALATAPTARHASQPAAYADDGRRAHSAYGARAAAGGGAAQRGDERAQQATRAAASA